MAEIKGTVEYTIFSNPENMYSVVEVNVANEPVTVTGNFPAFFEGETVTFVGEYKETKYGTQFQATSFSASGEMDVPAMTVFLASGLFRGVGEVTAEAITRTFGAKTFDVIQNEPSRLHEIKGISLKKAKDISDSYKDVVDMRETVMFLMEKGVTVNLAMKIYKQYGESTRRLMEKNPYKMVEDIDGVGFKTADAVAIKLGIRTDSDFRMRAAVIYLMRDNQTRQGSTCMRKEDIIAASHGIIELDDLDDKVEKILSDLTFEGGLRKFELDDKLYFALSSTYYVEKALAEKMKELDGFAQFDRGGYEKDIEEYEKQNGITLHGLQKEAVIAALSHGFCVITGGPGTGKTTIVKCIISAFKKRGKTVALVAPTGRAAKRLEETTGEEAKTIHRLLDLDYKDGKGHFLYNEDTRLDQDVVIVDEVSMCDVFLTKSLLNAVKYGGRVVLVGDKDQLASVGAGNVLADVLESDAFKSVELTQVYRQEEESLIVTNAHLINKGEMPILSRRDSDFFYSGISGQEEMLARVIEMATRTVPKFMNCSTDDIQILAPMKKGVVGVNNINVKMQETLNPVNKQKREMTIDGVLFREGDKVMQTVNNYQIEWTRGEGRTLSTGLGIYNGDIGKVEQIDAKNGAIVVLMEDGRRVTYDLATVNDLILSYAISVHKSQGSEFPVVIMPITGGNPGLYTRNLLYTAITRARKMVVLIGDSYNVKRMVDNNYIEKRDTMLKYFITGELQ